MAPLIVDDPFLVPIVDASDHGSVMVFVESTPYRATMQLSSDAAGTVAVGRGSRPEVIEAKAFRHRREAIDLAVLVVNEVASR